MTDDNCLSFAFKISDKRYSALIAIMPILFIIVELIKLSGDINNHAADMADGIRIARVVLCIGAAFVFSLLAIGGLVKWLNSPFEDARTIWWMVSGLEGMLAFIVLAVFQYRDFHGEQAIYESVFFWLLIVLAVGFIVWLILKGVFGCTKSSKLIAIDDDQIIISIKLTAALIFSAWLAYRPAALQYDTAGAVILILTLILALAYALIQKNRESWIYITAWTLLPVIVIFTSWYKGDEDNSKTLQYVYLGALILALVGYIALLVEPIYGFCCVRGYTKSNIKPLDV